MSQKATDFSSLVAKVGSSTKVVYLPFQLATEAQLFSQQMKAQGKSAVVFGSDGTFDSANFNTPGAYVSFFAPDVTTIAKDAKLVAQLQEQVQGRHHAVRRAELRAHADVRERGHARRARTARSAAQKCGTTSAAVVIRNTILGTPMKLTPNGDVAGAKFHIFKIQPDGSYKTVA